MTSLSDFFGDAEVIYRYTRADAIRDGVLVDVTATANEAGITVPVAVTAGVWQGYVAPSYIEDLPGQDSAGRLWDLLWMLTIAARRAQHTSVLFFAVLFLVSPDAAGGSPTHEEITFKAVCGPGDQGEPVITIMLPEED